METNFFLQVPATCRRLSAVADAGELSFLCQDKTFYVKTKRSVTENQQLRLAAVTSRFNRY